MLNEIICNNKSIRRDGRPLYRNKIKNKAILRLGDILTLRDYKLKSWDQMKKNGITDAEYFLLMGIYNAIPKDWINLLSGCLPKILINQIGHKIDFLQILYVNYTLSGYLKNTFRLGSKCFLRQFTRGIPWWTKMDILLVQKCQFSITLVTPHNT